MSKMDYPPDAPASKSRWRVDLRGTITRDIKRVEVDAWSMGAAMVDAVAAHPTYRAKSATEVLASDRDHQTMVEMSKTMLVVPGIAHEGDYLPAINVVRNGDDLITIEQCGIRTADPIDIVVMTPDQARDLRDAISKLLENK